MRRGLTRPAILAVWSLLSAIGGCGNLRVPDPAVRYIAFGDSSTRGTKEENYPEMLRALLGEPAGAFANEGHGGEDSAAGLERLKGLLEQGLYPNARTLLYWQGGIDALNFVRSTDPSLQMSPSDTNYPFRDQLNAMLDGVQVNIEAGIAAARAAGLDVYLATYYLAPKAEIPCEPLSLAIMAPEQGERADAYIRLLNERIRLAAAQSGARVVDVESVAPSLAADVANYRNCNHLSAQGNAVVAEVFRAVIQGAAPR